LKFMKVVVFQTSPQTLEEDIERVASTPEFNKLSPELETFIKINGNFDFVYPGSNTSGWFLEGLLKILREKGFKKLKVIEGDLPDFKADKMIYRTGLIEILRRYGVSFLAYENLLRDEREIPLFLKDKQLINLPVFHTHGYAVVSCATKNLFGLLPKSRRKYHKVLSEKLLEIAEQVKAFTIVDGTVGLEGESTRRGTPKRLDLILSGWDPLSIDVVVTRIMGYKISDIPLLSLAREKGRFQESKIEVNGDFNRDNLPKIDFALNISPQRKVIQALDHLKIGDFGPLIWFITKLRRMYHYYNYFKRKRELFSGPWMEYEKVWKTRERASTDKMKIC